MVSNIDFLGKNSSAAYGTNLSLVPVGKLQKYLKPVLQKLDTLQFPAPMGWVFKYKKKIVTNLKV